MKTVDKEKALRYLLEQTNASEYEDAYDNCNIAWNVIACIMESYAKEHAEPVLKLLEIAKCPNCDGSGAIGRNTLDGNGDPDVEWEQCQWCFERNEWINNKTNKL